MDTNDITDLTAMQLVRAYTKGDLSPVEAVEAFLDRIERMDEKVNAWRFVDRDRAMVMARRSEKRYLRAAPIGLLDGVPVAVKDDFAVAGWSTLHGSLATCDKKETSDAPATAGFRRHGAVLLGKTNLPEVGWKAVTDSPLTGTTRNPWDVTKTPGGSSGGNAAALALRMVPIAVGSDIGGSVRIPAAFCGVVGLKSTQGRTPMDPRTKTGMLLQAGPMARTVEDAAIANEVVNEWAPADPAPRAAQAREALEGHLRGVRIAFAPEFNGARPEPRVRTALEGAAAVLAEQGAWVEQAAPDMGDTRTLYERLYGPMLAVEVQDLPDEKRHLMDQGLLEAAAPWYSSCAADFLRAMYDRRVLIHVLHAFHQKYDLILTPTVPIAPFAVDRELPEGFPDERWYGWTPCTWPFNITGQPAISVPCGFTSAGLPIGAQLVAPRHEDLLALRAAHVYQLARPELDRAPTP